MSRRRVSTVPIIDTIDTFDPLGTVSALYKAKEKEKKMAMMKSTGAEEARKQANNLQIELFSGRLAMMVALSILIQEVSSVFR